jgi:hypothetical protein
MILVRRVVLCMRLELWVATVFVGLALVGKDIVFRFLKECSSLGDRFIRKVTLCFTPYFVCFRPPIPSFSGVRKVMKFY